MIVMLFFIKLDIEDVDSPKVINNLPKSKSVFLGDFKLACGIWDDVVSNELVWPSELFNENGWDNTDKSCNKFGIDKIFLFS